MLDIISIVILLVMTEVRANDVCSIDKYPDFIQGKTQTGDLQWNEVVYGERYLYLAGSANSQSLFGSGSTHPMVGK